MGDKKVCKQASVGKLADIECEVHGKLLHVAEGRLVLAGPDKPVHILERVQVQDNKRGLVLEQVQGSKRELVQVLELGSKLGPVLEQGSRRVLEPELGSKQVRVPEPGKPDDKLELVAGTLADTEQLVCEEHKPVLGHSKDLVHTSF